MQKEKKEAPVIPVLKVLWVLRETKVIKDLMVLEDLQVNKADLVLLVIKVSQEFLEYPGIPGYQVFPEKMDATVLMELQEWTAFQVLQVHEVIPEVAVLKETKEKLQDAKSH